MKLVTLVASVTISFCMMILTINSIHHNRRRHDTSASESLSQETRPRAAESDYQPRKIEGHRKDLDFVRTTEDEEERFVFTNYNGRLPTIADHFGAKEGVLSTGLHWKVLHEARPRVIYLENILSPEDCDAIVDVGTKRMMRSQVNDKDNNRSIVDQVRTSFGMFMQLPGERDHPANIRLRNNGHKITGIPEINIEATQLLRYYKGQYYKAHPDYFDEDDHMNLDRAGQRIATVLTWVHDCPEGGSTTFPLAGIEAKPKKGDAVLFYDVDYDMKVDPYSSHAANPPIGDSVKWVAVQWIHPRPFPS